MVTRRCTVCGCDKSVKLFYFTKRERRYQSVCVTCRNSGVLATHTHMWVRVRIDRIGFIWRWKYRCHICAETRVFSTAYAPASASLSTEIHSHARVTVATIINNLQPRVSV